MLCYFCLEMSKPQCAPIFSNSQRAAINATNAVHPCLPVTYSTAESTVTTGNARTKALNLLAKTNGTARMLSRT